MNLNAPEGESGQKKLTEKDRKEGRKDGRKRKKT